VATGVVECTDARIRRRRCRAANDDDTVRADLVREIITRLLQLAGVAGEPTTEIDI
jgi:hypothetical protein